MLIILANEAADPLSPWLTRWFESLETPHRRTASPDAVVAAALRGHPRLIVVDMHGPPGWQSEALACCTRLKQDGFIGVIPVVALAPAAFVPTLLEAGADEVIPDDLDEAAGLARCRALLRRSDRDLDTHPSTRLPGGGAIERELERRVRDTAPFAVGYVDLDHFKEFNDRYGYHEGDRVIRMVARLLHDIVTGWCGEGGFIGHIGGDDFLFAVPLEAMPAVCDDIVEAFSDLSPLQYSEQDRRMGYFFGKDRRGQLHRVPLMTLSIGVVSNRRRRFSRGGEVSALASEMKSYAKTLPGSVWAVDRRRDEPASESPVGGKRAREQLDQRSAGGR